MTPRLICITEGSEFINSTSESTEVSGLRRRKRRKSERTDEAVDSEVVRLSKLRRSKSVDFKRVSDSEGWDIKHSEESSSTMRTNVPAKRTRRTTEFYGSTVASAAIRLRRSVCGGCVGCRAQDCQICSNCIDMPKYGGLGRKKQRCSKRTCDKW